MNCCQHVNPFRLCTGLRVIGYCMILLVAALVGISYYAVVIVAWVPRLFGGGLSDGALALFILVLFHVLLVLLLWSYFKVVFTDPGPVPENWGHALRDDNMEAGTSSTTSPALVSPGVMSSAWSPTEGTIRRPDIGYCNRCQNSKPPRCHHCSVCQRCVLKMDHHCVWVVNCVGARNYKFFLLFLFYTFLETILDSLALLPRFINFFGDAKNHSGSPGHLAITFLAFVLNVAFALSLLCFLAMHSSLLLTNTTTIEVHEKKKTVRWKYDLGKRQNFEQVFGTKKLYWFLPLFSKEDLDNVRALQGLEFPVQSGER